MFIWIKKKIDSIMNWFLDILTYDKTIGNCEERVILQHSAFITSMFEPVYFLKIMPNFCQLVNLSNYEIKQIFGHQTWNSTTQLTPLLYILIGTDVHKVVLLKSHVYCFRWILDICKHERVLQAAKKILGPNIVLLSTCLITKYPNVDEKRVISMEISLDGIRI